jgi:hypothetical protein
MNWEALINKKIIAPFRPNINDQEDVKYFDDEFVELPLKSPEENIDTQTKYAQKAFDANVQNIQSAAKSASETAVKVFDIINKQAVTNISEFASQATAKAKKASN